MLFRNVFALVLVSVAFANPLEKRQGTNTNAEILPPLDALQTNVTLATNQIQLLQDGHTASDATVGPQILGMAAAFNQTATALSAISPSIGSNTTAPTNNDVAVDLGDSLSKLTATLSAITPAIVPSISTFLSELDPAVANAVDAFNKTAPPASSSFVHILMLDARQFFADENMTETLTALGFPGE
ncbi:hypothetical protein GYMLUDRAFT_260181 [Collybiopsis luxurians FD-317 M1]|uniref:Uncharacterized protein n=1 Tax=Collybiopsis luxurians FD-317 M1 TaxID=944289 RepID=A0A0D0CSU6_9AGAR|nr:hypothetical protein GYMLUDRAFT_260181 [Collybiopsis luxurians FD-317 M1]